MPKLGRVFKCAICDDDYAFLRGFQKRVEAWFAARGLPCACRIFITPSELLLESMDGFDIVFLNVDTGYWDGINIARSIRQGGGDPLVIFVSAYLQFAPHGYGVGAFRYLMKDELDQSFAPAMADAVAQLGAGGGWLMVHSHGEAIRLPLASLVYTESDKRVLTHHLRGWRSESLSAYGKLSELEAQLDGEGFLRVHRSYLVNMRYVEAIRNYEVRLAGGPVLGAGRQRYGEVLGRFKAWQNRRPGRDILG